MNLLATTGSKRATAAARPRPAIEVPLPRAAGDLDNDGDQDIYAVMGGAYAGNVYQNVLFENPGHGSRWITLRLEGVEANRAAIGARIRVSVDTSAGPRDVYATVSTGGSFGCSGLQREIGLGRASRVVAIEIVWPGSREPRRIGPLALDRAWRVRQGELPVEVELRRFELSPAAGAS